MVSKKIILVAGALSILLSCANEANESDSVDTLSREQTIIEDTTAVNNVTDSKTWANERFRNVTIEKIANDSFRVKGQAQIFEASFGWVIEDGHNELKEGFATSDAGAPEWGNFDFSFRAQKDRENSMLHIILFETSMKDGSRVHQLPIPLQ